MLHSSQQFTKKTFILNSPLFEMFENEDGTGHSQAEECFPTHATLRGT